MRSTTSIIKVLLSSLSILITPGWALAMQDSEKNPPIEKLKLSEAEWRKKLTPGQYKILRETGTEITDSSHLNDEHRKGTYVCLGCELPLFTSEMKYDSDTGWPSFYDVIKGHVEKKRDWSMIIPKTEYHCARCGGHQGHLFKDGPKPTGLRYCNNGVALKFIPEERWK